MKSRSRLALVILGVMTVPISSARADRPQDEERLSFQAGDSWNGRVNLNADVAMAYGIDESLPNRLKRWTDHGYIGHVMTGVSWGEYQEY